MRRALPVAAAVVVAGALLAGGWIWRELNAPHAGWEDSEGVVVELPRGLDAGSMFRRLGDAGVLRSPELLRLWVSARGGAEDLHAGEYRFVAPVSAFEVLDKLRRGEVVLHPVTVPEGLVLEQIARAIADAGLADHDAMLETLRDPEPAREFAPDAEDLEGYLFPETYKFPRGETPGAIAAAMVRRFLEQVDDAFREAAAELDLTPVEAVTLASLIEEETSVPEERGRISRVFHNRLKRGMKLQCDPTVLYALHRAGKPVRGLRLHHLEFDSPWNTYVIDGLPPSPICNPGLDSLRAAVTPDPGDDLYFVAAPGGGHTFSKSLAAHQKAVREWRRYRRSSR